MIDFIIQKAGGGAINLYSKNASTLSTVTNAEQSQGLNSDDIVRITVESRSPLISVTK
jgi:outer membrane receptor for monomeric catechols